MRKTFAILLAVSLAAAAVGCASAETPDLFSLIRGKTFEFASGAGAWSTELVMGEGGSFTGSFHDSEMGETGEGYPDGTVYGCSFHGMLADPVMLDETTWTVRILVEPDEGQVPEAVEDGIRFVTSAPYGVEKAQTVTVYLPGTPVNSLPEGFIFWSHLEEIAPDAETLPYYAIWSEEDEAGFITAVDNGTAAEAPALPAYVYTGDDPVEGAAAEMLANSELAKEYLTQPGYVTIPCPIIHKTEMTDENHAKVYGSFWILNYVDTDGILLNISGGEYPGIMELEKTGGEWRVTAFEEAGSGDDYAADIERFAAGDKGLEDAYYTGADLGSETNSAIRTRFIKAYVEANGLGITAYQDYGWAPVPLN